MNKISNKDFETLFQELIVTDSDDKTKLKEEFKTLKEQFYKTPSVYKNKNPFSLWTENDIRNWVTRFKKETHREDKKEQQNIRRQIFALLKFEAVIVVIKAMELTFGIPHDVQILSVLLLINKKLNKGRLAQIFTGEGKSLTISLLAALKVLEGRKVDIVTSSEVLAERDAKYGFVDFFKLLDITV